MAAVMGLIFVTARFGNLPERATQPPFPVAGFPVWTQAAIFLALAATAAVVEEAAFRGYMLSRIQRRHGWWIGILVVAILFYVAHLSHAWVTVAFVPFFLAYSALHGLLVFHTRSILPSVVLHALSDAIVLPIQFGVLPDPGRFAFVAWGGFSLVMACAAVPAFRSLARAARAEEIA
jgi:membrane protease YdiL (CAAX protease family)